MTELNKRDLTRQIELLCKQKSEEFKAFGYDNIGGEQIWECVNSKYSDEQPHIHQIVSDILSLKAENYMNWMMLKVYKGEEF